MGRKLESYTDSKGNTVRDGDEVYWNNKLWEVIYISDNYVNLYRNGGMHLPFSWGVPIRKISNKLDGPVRTVTRKEIVPGVYGAVGVQDGCLVNVAYMRTADELRAAAATLIEIADALEENNK